jgi:lipoprotein-anchoring transpeptidase ErfK/SrfK
MQLLSRTRRSTRAAMVATAVAVLLAACGGGSDSRPSLGARENDDPVTTTALAPNTSFTAQPLSGEVAVHQSPDESSPADAYPNPWQLDENPDHTVPQVFLVTQQNDDWAEVLLPVRPNGTTGWVKKSDVRLTPNRFRIEVSLTDHQITVYDGDSVMIQEPVAIGKESTPTPTGKYYPRVLLKAPDPNTVYGPYAFGLSGHSVVLTEFNGGDAELGIHGNNDASVLGQSVSAGCIRISNESITRLAGILPLGPSVEILP